MSDYSEVVQVGLIVIQVFGLYAVACFVGAGGGVLVAKTYLTAKIEQAVKHEYATKLAVLKADLAEENNKTLEILKAQLSDTNNTQLEILKAELKMQGDIAMERLKSDLTISAAQQNVEFTHLHTTRAQVIAQIHSELRDAVDMLADYTKPFEPAGGITREERRLNAAQAINTFIRTYRTKEIYLPEASADGLRQIEERLKFAFYNFFYAADSGQSLHESRTKQLLSIHDEVQKLSGPATKELQNDFRGLLGYRSSTQGLLKNA